MRFSSASTSAHGPTPRPGSRASRRSCRVSGATIRCRPSSACAGSIGGAICCLRAQPSFRRATTQSVRSTCAPANSTSCRAPRWCAPLPPYMATHRRADGPSEPPCGCSAAAGKMRSRLLHHPQLAFSWLTLPRFTNPAGCARTALHAPSPSDAVVWARACARDDVHSWGRAECFAHPRRPVSPISCGTTTATSTSAWRAPSSLTPAVVVGRHLAVAHAMRKRGSLVQSAYAY